MARFNNNSILLVEDDEDLRNLLADRLELMGYTVSKVSNGREALELIAEVPEPWYALITDYNMPFVNGGELLKALNSLGVSFERTIMVTSEADFNPIIEGLVKAKMCSTLSKPFVFKDLLSLVG